MTGASQEHGRKRSSPLVGCLVAVFVMLPIAYPLSHGPAVWLNNRGYVGEWIYYFYLPLGFLVRNCEPFHEDESRPTKLANRFDNRSQADAVVRGPAQLDGTFAF